MKIRMEVDGSFTGDCDISLINEETGERFPTIYQASTEGTYLYAKDIKELITFCGATVVQSNVTKIL